MSGRDLDIGTNARIDRLKRLKINTQASTDEQSVRNHAEQLSVA